MRSPVVWFGGKGMIAPKLLALLPPHDYYVEPFGGGASLLFAKPLAKVETYNDMDEGLVGFFRVLRDPVQGAEFERRLEWVMYSRAEYNLARATWREQTDPVERALRWFTVARQSFGGRFGSMWGTALTESCRGMAHSCSKWTSIKALMPAIRERFSRVQIECVDWRRIVERYDSPGTLLYADPPYVTSTRRDGGYAHEMTDHDHEDLVAALLAYPAMVMLSGYPHPTYEALDHAGWDRVEFQTACHAAGRTRTSNLQGKGAALKHQSRTEVVWRNPAAMSSTPLLADAGGFGR